MSPSDSSAAGFFGDRRTDAPAPDAPHDPDLTPEQAALVAEACSKSGLVWVRPADSARAVAAWHVWHEDAVHVVSGVDEQLLPLLTGVVEVTVPSKDAGSRLLVVLCRADLLAVRSPEWEAAADVLSAKRLNALDPASQRERWAAGTVITRLVPLRVVAAGPGADDEPSGAAPPPPSAGTTRGDYAPWHLTGRRARARRLAAGGDPS